MLNTVTDFEGQELPKLKKNNLHIDMTSALRTMIKEPSIKKFAPVALSSRVHRNEKLSFQQTHMLEDHNRNGPDFAFSPMDQNSIEKDDHN